MKLGHAAALAVIGWYLMIPPVHDGQPDTQAAISAWTVFRSSMRGSLPGVEVEA
jgi:hypothetical protein